MVGDPATYANFSKVVAKDYSLDWTVDFDKTKIIGQAVIKFEVLQNTDEIILDGRSLNLKKVTLDGKELKYSVAVEAVRGQKITIQTGSLSAGSQPVLTINYETDNATALQFLQKEQTADKKAPFLFSQCQAIHARSIVPCMDTPSVKATYHAKVSVPKGLTCLMSAICTSKSTVGDRDICEFKQSVPIPSYLIAIVVGHMEKRDISDRCAVWAEPSIADGALWEFESTEKILKVAEELAGPYVWGRYDMVVLPPTFPFGGMENPCLTFITPTLLAGDRSLVNVVAHEISHSWTGNLVTNANWEHFWLNEGFTVFLERKIHGRMFGEKERQFESQKGYDDTLKSTIITLADQHEFTKLIQNQHGIDPDDAFSSVPYEKGSAFLFTIEQAIGDMPRFEEFLRFYIKKHAYKTVTTDVWKADLYSFFADKKDVLDKIDWNLWLTKAGLPPRPTYDSTLMDACKSLSDKWLSDSPPSDSVLYDAMSPSQKEAFLGYLRASNKFDVSRMPALSSKYKLEDTKNCEIRFNYLMLGLETRWEPVISPALAFVLTIGRMKYCRPIYKALFNWNVSKDAAVTQFKKNIPFMHPITAGIISKLLPK